MRALLLLPLAVLLCSSSPPAAPARAPRSKTVLVAKRALRMGEPIAAADLDPLVLPAEWVTSSFVEPDAVQYILGQKLRLPVAAGDPMQWVDFDLDKDPVRCLEAIGAKDTALEQIARHRAAILGGR